MSKVHAQSISIIALGCFLVDIVFQKRGHKNPFKKCPVRNATLFTTGCMLLIDKVFIITEMMAALQKV